MQPVSVYALFVRLPSRHIPTFRCGQLGLRLETFHLEVHSSCINGFSQGRPESGPGDPL